MNFYEKYGTNNKNYLGIIQFVFDFLNFEFNPKYGIAPMHVDLLRTFMQDRADWIREDRMYCFAAFRESAKTTWFGVAVPVYFCCMNGHIYWEDYLLPDIKYTVIKGKTAASAEKTMLRIQQALLHKNITESFEDFVPTIKDVKDKKGKSNSRLLICKNGSIFESLGINQQIRGTNLLGHRVDYCVYDDPESTENTKTEERRSANNNDLFMETIGAIDSNIGRLVYIGNMVHQDCLLSHLIKNKEWKRRFYALTYKDKEGVEQPTWPQRFPMSLVKRRYNFFKNQPKSGGLKTFYQEYYNKIISDITPVFKRDTEWKFVRKNNINFLQKGNEYRNIYVSIGYDPAQSEKTLSSDSAIAVMAVDADGQKYIIDYFLGKLDLHDKYEPGAIPIYPFALSNEDLERVFKRGGIEETCRYCVKYNTDIYYAETAGQQRGIFNEISERLSRVTPDWLASKKVAGRNVRNAVGCTYQPHIDKVQKLSASVMREFEAGAYICTTDKYEIENIVETFPHCKLDLLDAIHLADMGLMAPRRVDYDALKTNQREEIPYSQKIKSKEAWMVQ